MHKSLFLTFFLAFFLNSQNLEILQNVKNFGATGNGITDDTVAVQNALSKGEATGTPVFFPTGTYCISQTLVLGNGNDKFESTFGGISIFGTGRGMDATKSRSGNSIIKWCGKAPEQVTYMFEVRGPLVGFRLTGIQFDANTKKNLQVLLLQQVSHYAIRDTGWYNNTERAILSTTVNDNYFPYGACNGTWDNIYGGGGTSSASGIEFTGKDTKRKPENYAVPCKTCPVDSCGLSLTNVTIYHGNDMTFGLKFGFADNIEITRSTLMSDTGSAKACGVVLERQVNNNSFPHELSFRSISATHGICGNAGWGVPNLFWAWNQGDCAFNCDLNFLGGTKAIFLNSISGSLQNIGPIKIENSSGAANPLWLEGYASGTKMFSITRPVSPQEDQNSTDIYAYDKVQISAPYGLRPSKPIKYSQLPPKWSYMNGSILYCTDCKHGSNPCTAGGDGAIAKLLNGSWRCN